MTGHQNPEATAVASRSIFRRLWDGWTVVAARIGHVQSRVILTVLYFTVLLPFVLLVRLSPDSRREKRRGPSNWVALESNDDDAGARMQF